MTNLEYWEKYWNENGDKINKDRRNKYSSDPEYAEKQRQNSRNYRKRKRREVIKLRKLNGEEVVKKGGGPRKPQLVELNGEKVEAVTIGHVAKRIDVKLSKLIYWNKIGILPDSPFKTEKGNRLYTGSMIEVIRRAVNKRDKIIRTDRSFYEEVEEGWRDIVNPQDFGRVSMLKKLWRKFKKLDN